MNKLSLADVTRLIDAVNARRLELYKSEHNAEQDSGHNPEQDSQRKMQHNSQSVACMENSDEEQRLNAIFQTNNSLAVYGTLAPGRSNYHIVEHLGGEWTEGLIEGNLQETGWGATLGYPAFRPKAGGPILQIRVLKSSLLPNGWADLDEFEGHEYQRILVPVFCADAETVGSDRRLYTVANLYAARE